MICERPGRAQSLWYKQSQQSTKGGGGSKNKKWNLLAECSIVGKIDSNPWGQDAPYPGNGAADAHHGAPDGGGVKFCCENMNYAKCSGDAKFSGKNKNCEEDPPLQKRSRNAANSRNKERQHQKRLPTPNIHEED